MDVQIIMFVLVWTGILKEDIPGKIRISKLAAQKLYEEDNIFKEKISEMVNSSKDFNTLLGKVSSSSKDLLDCIERGVAK